MEPEDPKMTAAKFWVSLASVVVASLLQVFTTGTVQQVLTIIAVVLGAVGVYFTKNKVKE